MVTICQTAPNAGPFVKDFFEINVNDSLWCSTEVDLFHPNYTNSDNSLNFKLTVMSTAATTKDHTLLTFINTDIDPLFTIDEKRGILRMNLRHKSLRLSNYFILKLTANESAETILAVKVDPTLAKLCSTVAVADMKKQLSNQNNGKLKLLFADTFDSYDFNRLFRGTADDNSSNNGNKKGEDIFLSEDLLVGSFICYVLVQSNLDVKLVGIDSDTFR